MKSLAGTASLELQFTIDEFRAGEDRIFELLHQQFRAFLQIFTMKIVKETNAASDLASDSILSLWLNRKSINSLSHLRNSLLKIAYHKSLDFKKESQRRVERELNYGWLQMDAEHGHLEAMIREEAQTEMQNELLENLDSLPSAWRNVIRMAYWEGMKNQEIAEKLNLSINTVKFYKTSGMKELRYYYGLYPSIFYPIIIIKHVIRVIFSSL